MSIATSHVVTMGQIVQDTSAAMAKAQQAQKVNYHRRHTVVEYQVGDTVVLSTRQVPTVGLQKLMPCFVGPFCITQKIGKHVYEVQLPPTMAQIHPVFHVFQLRLFPIGIGE